MIKKTAIVILFAMVSVFLLNFGNSPRYIVEDEVIEWHSYDNNIKTDYVDHWVVNQMIAEIS